MMNTMILPIPHARAKRSNLLPLLSVLLVLILSPLTTAHGQAVNSLEEITTNALPGNRLQVSLRLASPPQKPLSFTIHDPARIVLDFQNTVNNLKQSVIPIEVGLAQSISTVKSKNRTRVVLNLSQLVPYNLQTQGDTIYLTLENDTSSNSSLAGGSSATDIFEINREPNVIAQQQERSVKNIDFRRGSRGEGRLIIELSDAGIPIDLKEEGGRVIVDILNTKLPQHLSHRLSLLDFATPAKTVDSFVDGKNTRIIITPATSDFEHLAYQTDETYTVELKPMAKEELEKRTKEKFGYTGERLSINFQDIEVRSVLQLLANFTELNVVISDTVTGNLTIRLKQVPWDQALDIILTTKGLGKEQSGNVLTIAPNEEIATRNKLELEAQQQVQELAPLRSDFIRINYAKAADLAALLGGTGTGAEGGETGAPSLGLVSERGSVSVDVRTNTLLLQETAERLTEIRALINELDVPIRQVAIESRIVIANDDFNRELGIRFGTTRDTREDPLDNGTISSGRLPAVQDIYDGSDVDLTSLQDRMNVNLNTSNPFGAFSLALARLPLGTLLELELSALQAEGRGEVISTPRVQTSNQKEARIMQGVEIPYLQATASGATAVAFKEAVLSLLVTPQITPDDRIILDLKVNNDTVGEIFNEIPSINTREVSTQVLVDNGETVVLGGVYQQTTRDEMDKVPFFGDLPIVGRLFRRTITENDKAELLIFVTPKIIKDKFGVN